MKANEHFFVVRSLPRWTQAGQGRRRPKAEQTGLLGYIPVPGKTKGSTAPCAAKSEDFPDIPLKLFELRWDAARNSNSLERDVRDVFCLGGSGHGGPLGVPRTGSSPVCSSFGHGPLRVPRAGIDRGRREEGGLPAAGVAPAEAVWKLKRQAPEGCHGDENRCGVQGLVQAGRAVPGFGEEEHHVTWWWLLESDKRKRLRAGGGGGFLSVNLLDAVFFNIDGVWTSVFGGVVGSSVVSSRQMRNNRRGVSSCRIRQHCSCCLVRHLARSPSIDVMYPTRR